MSFLVTFIVVVNLGSYHLVDALYQRPRESPTESSLEEAVLKWKLLELGLKNVVDNLLNQMATIFVKIKNETNLSSDCTMALNKLYHGLKNGQVWAFEMLDASGKNEGGFLSGTGTSFGDYDQCLNIRLPQNDGRGQYCFLDIYPPLPPKPEKLYNEPFTPFQNISTDLEVISLIRNNSWIYYTINLRIAVCVPSLCSKEDLQEIAEAALPKDRIQIDVSSCEVREEETMDGVQKAIMFVLILIAGIIAAASVVDYLQSDTKHTDLWRNIVEAFSVQRNMSKLLDTSKEQDNSLSCLQGMRFYSMCWIIVSHTALVLEYTQSRRVIVELRRSRGLLSQILVNTFIILETFYFMTGTILSYTIIKAFHKRVFHFNVE